jgi:hypothetical protein
VIKPTKSLSLTFVSDGTSLEASFDLAKQPLQQDFNGSLPDAVLTPQITNLPVGVTFTTVLVGTTVSFTFSGALPEFDGSNNTILYVATFLLTFGG